MLGNDNEASVCVVNPVVVVCMEEIPSAKPKISFLRSNIGVSSCVWAATVPKKT